jgi:hypothetical protein
LLPHMRINESLNPSLVFMVLYFISTCQSPQESEIKSFGLTNWWLCNHSNIALLYSKSQQPKYSQFWAYLWGHRWFFAIIMYQYQDKPTWGYNRSLCLVTAFHGPHRLTSQLESVMSP